MREPVVHAPAIGFANKLNAEPDLGQGYYADIKLIKRTTRYESHNPLFGLWPAQFRQNIGIEQPRHQDPTSRTGRRSRVGSRSISLYREACIAATKSAPVAARVPFDARALCSAISAEDFNASIRASSAVWNEPFFIHSRMSASISGLWISIVAWRLSVSILP